ncbi:hypothetical protein AA11826_2204 [Komagataeibacter oboediens DSM 11826]|nr:hypothetical protein AA11826_2204 [Komagataeibacter oboediens DSM 11826]
MSQASTIRGQEILNNPARNKETAFTMTERQSLGLEGLLPPTVENIDRQLERVQTQLAAKPNDLERYIYLMSLAARNETLFYHTLMSTPRGLCRLSMIRPWLMPVWHTDISIAAARACISRAT